MQFTVEQVRVLCGGEFPNYNFDWEHVEHFVFKDGLFFPVVQNQTLSDPGIGPTAIDDMPKVQVSRVRIVNKPNHKDILVAEVEGMRGFYSYMAGSTDALHSFLEGVQATLAVTVGYIHLSGVPNQDEVTKTFELDEDELFG